jgi:nitrate/nitrite transporter NarK
MMASISSQYWHYILSQGVLLGMGLGSSFSPALACVSSYYRRQRGLANGLLSAGSAIGGLIIPIFLSKMINNPSIGLGWAHRTCGFICLVMQGGAFLLMRQKKTIKNTRPLLDFTVYRQPAYCFTVAALFLCTLSIFVRTFKTICIAPRR